MRLMSRSMWIALALIGAGAIGLIAWRGMPAKKDERAPIARGTPLRTGPTELASSRRQLQEYLVTHPSDVDSAVRFADLALREVRVTGNGGLAVAAEDALRRAIRDSNRTYEAERMLAGVLLSQHRFREARQLAERLVATEPADSWLQGVIGDAALEEGEYPEAFAAFDRMVSMRPDSASYARVAYARELQGDLEGALEVMQMALEGASPHDLESQAWHACQVGALQFQLDQLRDARRSYEKALFTYPKYPLALAGRAEVLTSLNQLPAAVESLRGALAEAPAASWRARLGDLHAALGDAAAAEREYRLADAAWASETPEPREQARFLATHRRDIARARTLATEAARGRRDIYTMDAVAWTAHVAGDAPAADTAIREALRTGSRDRRIRYHAAEISAARGDVDTARDHLTVALAGDLTFDLIEAPAARQLLQRLGGGNASRQTRATGVPRPASAPAVGDVVDQRSRK